MSDNETITLMQYIDGLHAHIREQNRTIKSISRGTLQTTEPNVLPEVKPITTDDYIKQLHIQIKELHLMNEFLTQTDDRKFNHENARGIGDGCGLTLEQFCELEKAVRHWFQQIINLKLNPSVAFEQIYIAQLPVRERMIMAYLLGLNVQGFMSAFSKLPPNPIGGGGTSR